MRPEDAIARLPVPARRAAYRTAHGALRVWWVVRRPRTRGVKCLLNHDGRVLFIRHSYGDRRVWELPGGGVARRETPEQAVVREAREELGVTLAWRPVAVIEVRDDKTSQLHVFAANAPSAAVTVDRGEILEARWAAPDTPPQPLSPSAAAILAL